jgi:Fe2+ transport system protein B
MLGSGTILVVGNLKVGKSTIFSHLAGKKRQRIQIEGSGLELDAGRLSAGPYSLLLDTPGFYSLQDRSEDAGLVRDLLRGGRAGAALLVLDSKNLARGLKLFLELAEYDIPVTVALNMSDEARQRGVEVDVSRLSEILGVEVVPTVPGPGRTTGVAGGDLAASRPHHLEGAPGGAEPQARQRHTHRGAGAVHHLYVRGLVRRRHPRRSSRRKTVR